MEVESIVGRVGHVANHVTVVIDIVTCVRGDERSIGNSDILAWEGMHKTLGEGRAVLSGLWKDKRRYNTRKEKSSSPWPHLGSRH